MRQMATAFLVLVSMIFAGFAVAEEYPTKPILIIVPFAPGGSTDLMARTVADKLGKKWGQQVIVENRTGGAGMVGVRAVMSAAPDGYTLLVGTHGELTVSPSLYKAADYDATKDLTPITMLARNPFVIAAHAGSKMTSVQELVKQAKANPGTVTFASGGAGSTNHFAGVLFAKAAGVDLLHVPYKGAGPSAVAVASGEVDVAFLSPTAVKPHVDAGNIKALAVTSAQRQAFAPDLPTAQEAGVPGYEFDAWIGMLAPAGTPDAIVKKLNSTVQEILADPEFQAQLAKLGLTTAGMDSDAFSKIIAKNTKEYAEVIKEFNIVVDQ